ncbi:MAG: nitrate reductase cytochrome c-type subunit [Actinomycetota bacterium]
MKTTSRILLAFALVGQLMASSMPGFAADGGLPTLRGAPIDAAETESTDPFRTGKDQPPIPRDYVQQPPLIPHKVDGYNVTKNFNKCMDCHAWNRYKETGATKVSLTHFKTRDGQELSNISPRRYFCQTCHVAQVDAKPLVANTFQRAKGLQ